MLSRHWHYSTPESLLPITLFASLASPVPSVVPRCCEWLWHTAEHSCSVAVDMLAAVSFTPQNEVCPAWETNQGCKWSFLTPGSGPTRASPASSTTRKRDRDQAAAGERPWAWPRVPPAAHGRACCQQTLQIVQAGGVLCPSHLQFEVFHPKDLAG